MDRFGPIGKVSKKRVHLGGPLFPVGPVGISVEWIAPIVLIDQILNGPFFLSSEANLSSL